MQSKSRARQRFTEFWYSKIVPYSFWVRFVQQLLNLLSFLPSIQDVMSPDHLVRISQCGCSTSDVARMEKIICSKLNWELDSPNPLTFLELFHAWCVSESVLGNKAEQHQDHVDKLTNILEGCMCNFPLTLFQVSNNQE